MKETQKLTLIVSAEYRIMTFEFMNGNARLMKLIGAAEAINSSVLFSFQDEIFARKTANRGAFCIISSAAAKLKETSVGGEKFSAKLRKS